MLRVQKWGNSAAVRLPADMLKQLDFKIGDEISLCGRFQSRTYTTKEEKTRTIQEVVINEASLWKEEEASNNG